MKCKLALIFFVMTLLSACMKPENKLQNCSVKIGQVEFVYSLNQALEQLKVKEPHTLTMFSGEKSDFFNSPNGKEKFNNAPILFIPLDMTKPFTFSAKISPEFGETYDAGALYLYVNENKWLKFAFEMDEHKKTRIVTVRTDKTSDDNNHDVVNSPFIYLKISSDAESIGYYYSIDNINWQLVRVYRNDFPSDTYVGISSQSPLDKGINTTFEDISLVNKGIKDFRNGI